MYYKKSIMKAINDERKNQDPTIEGDERNFDNFRVEYHFIELLLSDTGISHGWIKYIAFQFEKACNQSDVRLNKQGMFVGVNNLQS